MDFVPWSWYVPIRNTAFCLLWTCDQEPTKRSTLNMIGRCFYQQNIPTYVCVQFFRVCQGCTIPLAYTSWQNNFRPPDVIAKCGFCLQACNYLVLNLAVADCVVCAVVVPVILTNMLVAGSWFSKVLCYVSVGLSGVACHTAAVTMTFIALNRWKGYFRLLVSRNCKELSCFASSNLMFDVVSCVWVALMSTFHLTHNLWVAM